jgi:hypothetical protein
MTRWLPTVLALGLALAAAVTQAQLNLPRGGQPELRFPGPSILPAPGALPPAQARPAAPNQYAELEKAGETAAHGWLLLLDRKDWGTAWDGASQVFRQAVPLPAWMDNIPKLREPFGAFIERKPVEVAYKKTLPGRPDGEYVTVQFASRFAKKDDVQEIVTTVRDTDGRWRVTGYTAR